MPTTPQDHKSKAETSTEPFTFDIAGEQHTLPPASAITAGMLRRFRKLEDLDAAFSILEEVAAEETLTALDALPLTEFNDILADWQKHIGIDAGN